MHSVEENLLCNFMSKLLKIDIPNASNSLSFISKIMNLVAGFLFDVPDNFRPFRILTSIEDIRKICDRIQQTDIKLKKIQLLDFYRNKINIESSNYQNVSTFYFQQSSIDMLQEIIND